MMASENGAPAIEICDLRVDYGDFVAVDDMSLSVPAGEVFGLVGPNGAGKTSTFRVVATLMEPTYGEVRLGGIDILEFPQEARRIIGYMPDLAPVPSDLRAREFLEFHADTHGLGSRRDRRARADDCLEIVRLADKAHAWCKTLSRGETQRLVLAKTLLHRPEILILDEPASGLDPLSRRELRLALQRLAQSGATVMVSSHILGELTEMCSSIGVMSHGRLLAAGPSDHVHRQLSSRGKMITATFLDGGAAKAAEWLAARIHVSDISVSHGALTFGFAGEDHDQAALLEALAGGGFRLKSFEEKRVSFEEILVEIASAGREDQPRS